jgi:thioredoxin 2
MDRTDRKTYVPCERCGVLNRVSRPAPGKSVRCGKCKARLALHDGVVDVGQRGLTTLVEKSPLPVVVDFWADWCAPCRVFAPVFRQVAGERFGQAVFAKLDTEQAGSTAQGYGIDAIPTLVVFREGRELARKWGALPEDELSRWLDGLV